MVYLLQLWKAILSKYGVRDLDWTGCDVKNCSRGHCDPQKYPLAVQQLGALLCQSHLDVLLGSIQVALDEAKELGIAPLEDLITLMELRELLFPSGNPRLRLVENVDARDTTEGDGDLRDAHRLKDVG